MVLYGCCGYWCDYVGVYVGVVYGLLWQLDVDVVEQLEIGCVGCVDYVLCVDCVVFGCDVDDCVVGCFDCGDVVVFEEMCVGFGCVCCECGGYVVWFGLFVGCCI